MDDWLIYRGTGEPDPERMSLLPEAPAWRRFDGTVVPYEVPPVDSTTRRRLGNGAGAPKVHSEAAVELVNAALYLRRPLLVTGEPGSGKSTLAHAVAHELGLGRVLQWPVVSRTTLRDGLYQYDAIGRLQDSQLGPGDGGAQPDGIGRYIRLGPLGTALLPTERPRVLLVDELDKSDIDLPNDLLHVLEEGEFTIPELERIADRQPETTVLTDDGARIAVHGGKVRCRAFPFIVITSNGERDFPAALLRRCLSLELSAPGPAQLAALVEAHFGPGGEDRNHALIERFVQSAAAGELRPADQLLNAIFLVQLASGGDAVQRGELIDMLMRPIAPRYR
ncbi:AAA domain-containing protein [Streptomyces sp. p1417]|uniref:AAA domain-containing protein n=1 Tax=Streptomyces typhae TaxID=2681492 RepID=A0A6L6WS75_9ACTN|nr:MoxR family ATPase [Streptomyces typhae]MVO84913.1 AAA domain-containing protein [Streptomyces typhae]